MELDLIGNVILSIFTCFISNQSFTGDLKQTYYTFASLTQWPKELQNTRQINHIPGEWKQN